MTGHTPGPWDYDAGDFSLFVLETFEPLPVTEENARIQAAAPNLLEACQRALAEAVADDQDEWYANTRDAVAKATGEPDQ